MPSSASFIPSGVKSFLVPEITTWFSDLNLERVRVSRPSKFLFLCGGAQEIRTGAKAANLRDYLLRVRPIKLKSSIVLAEKATQIYRDTSYADLITFEEDIARISAVVLVIAESAGSLAELGAFASSEIIRQSLRVIIPSQHDSAESFVRYGPVQRMRNIDRGYIGVYPWKVHSSGGLNVSSTKPHYREIVKFINNHLDSVPKSYRYNSLNSELLFYIIYWIVHLSTAISPTTLYGCVQSLIPHAVTQDIRNKIYCMELAGWIKRESYSGDDYFYSMFDEDPFHYSYNDGVIETSSVRRKLAVKSGLERIERVPRYVLRQAASARVSSP
jgi:hypothetical protein